MSRQLKVRNYTISTSLFDIISDLRSALTNGKLADIEYANGHENIVVTCPHHAGGTEKKAACNIYVGNSSDVPYGYAYCFVCGFRGSFVKFVAECFEASEKFAEDWLIEHYGSLDYAVVDLGPDLVLKNNLYTQTFSACAYLDDSSLNEYQDWCDYFGHRHLTRELAKYFNLKYDPKKRQVLFPCYDEYGRLLTVPARSIDTKTFYLDKDVDKPIFGINKIYENLPDSVLITEGPFDMLLANQFGFPAVAMLGSPSESQFNKINKVPVNRIYLMFDNDMAGRKFNKKFHERLASRFLITDVTIPVGYKDIGELDYSLFWTAIKKAENI